MNFVITSEIEVYGAHFDYVRSIIGNLHFYRNELTIHEFNVRNGGLAFIIKMRLTHDCDFNMDYVFNNDATHEATIMFKSAYEVTMEVIKDAEDKTIFEQIKEEN